MPNPSQNNEQLTRLMARVGQGDHAAFEQVYKVTSAHLFGVALRILKHRGRAEDVLQEAYVNIWNHAGSYAAGLASPMTWLISVVRNKSLDSLRYNKSADESTLVLPDDEGDAHHGVDDGADPAALFLQASEAMRIRECMTQLEAVQRQSLALAFYDGLSHAELALHLQAPLGTVKAWVRRGLEKLKKCMDGVDTAQVRR
jgi:RNA polymerase sigma-70 factor (ECF subfamily)